MNALYERTADAVHAPFEPDIRELREAVRQYEWASGQQDDLPGGVIFTHEGLGRAVKGTTTSRQSLVLFDPQDSPIEAGVPDMLPVVGTGTCDVGEMIAGALAGFLLRRAASTAGTVRAAVLVPFTHQHHRFTTPSPTLPLFREPMNDAEQYRERLDDLREAARDEGYAVNEDSVADFRAFLKATPFALRRPLLALVDDGDVRASWRTGDRRLAVQFLGGGFVEYVLLDTQPVVDRGSIEGFWRLRDLESVLKAP